MSFIERAFTPPGTGGQEAAAQVAAGEAAKAAQATQALAAPPVPAAPAPPKAPASFDPGAAPGARQRAAVTGTSILGAAATAGQTARKQATVLG
jgi:hypothetical protein